MRKSISRIILLVNIILLIFVFKLVNAQEYNCEFINLNISSGLADNNISKITQDNDGFIWIGTPTGIVRYDGFNFYNFSSDSINSQSIFQQNTNDILVDSYGEIWIASDVGVLRFNSKTGKSKIYQHDEAEPTSLSSNFVYKIFEDKEGNIWIGTINGLNKFNRQNDNFINFIQVANKFNTDKANSVVSIEEDDNGNLWLGTWDGLTQISKKGKIIDSFFYNQSYSNQFYFRIISEIFNDGMGNLWIGMNSHGLKKYNQKTGKFTNYYSDPSDKTTISNGFVKSIVKDQFNRLWIGTISGLNIYDYETDSFTRITKNSHQLTYLQSDQIHSLLLDRSGLLWIGTLNGISKYYPSENNFEYIGETANNKVGLSDGRLIDCFVDDEDNVWIATMEGANKIDGKTGKITHFLHNKNNPNSVCDNFIRSIYRDSKGIVWMGTNEFGLNSFNPRTNEWEIYLFDPQDLSTISNSGVVTILEDSKGYLWFGTWWGLNKFDRKTKKFTRFISDQSNPAALQNNIVWDIFEDSRGKIWVATNGGGVSLLNEEDDSFLHFTNNSSSRHKISSNKVFNITETEDGIMWFGTPNGLNSFDRLSGEVNLYNEKNGLSSKIINAVIEGEKNNLWIATNKGLTYFDRNKNNFAIYNKQNGLRSNFFVQNIADKNSKGKIFLGSFGLCSFYPKDLVRAQLQAPVILTDFKIFNESVKPSPDGILKRPISHSNFIVIPPGNDVISFEFALLDYFDANNHIYKYKLEGFDSDWHFVGKRNIATYTNISPGSYKFVINATNNKGNETWAETSIDIVIVPKFYQSLWFQAVIVISLIITIGLFIKYKTNRINRQNRELEKKVHLRTIDLAKKTEDLDKTVENLNQEIATKDKFFSIIAHDLRSPFMSLLGFSKHLSDEVDSMPKDDIKLISNSIQRSAGHTFGLLQNLLQWARIQTGKIDFEPKNIEIKPLILQIEELYQGNVQNKNINLKVEVDKDFSAYADQNMIETVIRNLLSNAIKFTNINGQIILKAFQKNGSTIISVKDSGIGMPEDHISKLFTVGSNISTSGTNNESGSGLGLILCKEFLDYNKGQIFIKSEIGKGTEISFTLPTRKS